MNEWVYLYTVNIYVKVQETIKSGMHLISEGCDYSSLTILTMNLHMNASSPSLPYQAQIRDNTE